MEVDATSFRALLGRSSQVEPKLRASLRRNIRRAADGLAEQVKAEAMQDGGGAGASAGWGASIRRAKGGESTGLRQGIAAGVKVAIMTGQSREGVRITSSGFLSGAWQAQRGWRHPIFGNRSAWMQQHGRPGFFYRTISAGRGEVRVAVESAMAEAISSLEGS